MNYNQLVQAVQVLMEQPAGETDWTDVISRMIEYAELRLYREMDFIKTIMRDTATLTANARDVTVPATIIIVRSANLISPSTTTAPASGTRRPLQRVGYDYIDMVYPEASVPLPMPTYPQVYAMLDDRTAIVGPSPSAAYTVEFVGTFRPAALSPTNQNTYLTDNMPDMFLSACMIFGSEYQRDAESKTRYEKQYTDQFAGVNIETLRQKAASVSWTPYQPTPQANVPRERVAAGASQ